MPRNYVPIFIIVILAAAVPVVTLALAKLFRPAKADPEKLMPYECGVTPLDTARGRYTVRFYLVAILFVVFDVETVFLFPWALRFRSLGTSGFVEMMLFILVLVVGLVYAWRKGALQWV